MRGLIAAIGAVVFIAVVPAAQADVQPYRTNDFGGFRDVLPPGTNGLANLVELAAFLATGARPPHNDDQRDMYRGLLYATPGVTAEDLGRSSRTRASASRPATARAHHARAPTSRSLRDSAFGVPHVYGTTRGGGDVRRRLRRRRGPPVLHRRAAPPRPRAAQLVRRRRAGNRAMDAEQWRSRPTPRPTCSARSTSSTTSTATRGASCRTTRATTSPASTSTSPRRGWTPRRCPASTRRSASRWGPTLEGHRHHRHGVARRRDLRQGRRRELPRWSCSTRFLAPLRRAPGRALWREWAAYEDADAPTTVQGKRFPYQTSRAAREGRRQPPTAARSGPGSRARRRPAGTGGLLPGGNGSGRRHAGPRRAGVPPLPGLPPAAARRAARRCPTRSSSRPPSRPAAARSRSSARRSPTSRRRSSWSRTSTRRASTRAAPPSRA